MSFRQKTDWLKAATVLSLIGLALKLLSFRTFKSWYMKFFSLFSRKAVPSARIPEIAQAVKSASRVLPVTLECLPQALATRFLLGRTENINLFIGVNKDPAEGLNFHAWVEKDGETIIGDLPASYQPFWIWN